MLYIPMNKNIAIFFKIENRNNFNGVNKYRCDCIDVYNIQKYTKKYNCLIFAACQFIA